MGRAQLGDTELSARSDQGGLHDVLAPRQSRHEGRLINHQQVGVLKKEAQLTRDRALGGGSAVEVDVSTGADDVAGGEGATGVVDDLPGGKAFQQGGLVVLGVAVALGRDELAEEVEGRGGLRRMRQGHPGGIEAILNCEGNH